MLFKDLRFALRSLTRNPLLASVAVLTLALGIGANTAIFSLANWALLRGLPGVRNADQLAGAYLEERILGFDGTLRPPLSLSTVDRYRSASMAMIAGAADNAQDLHVGGLEGMPAERVRGQLVTSNYFSMLGVPLEIGRAFSPDEDRMGAGQVAVLSHRFWSRAFGSTRDIVGRRIVVNGKQFTVVGVAADGFVGLDLARESDMWIPAGAADVVQPKNDLPGAGPQEPVFDRVILRLRHGVTATQAQVEATRLLRAEGMQRPSANGRSGPAAVVDEHVGLPATTRDRVAHLVTLLMGGVALVLLIACANVANLLLARGVGRKHEIALRSALGASRWRLVRLFLAESMLLATVAGVAGVTLATWGMALLSGMKVTNALPAFPALSPDGRVIAFAFGLTMLTVIAAGLLPALRSARAQPAVALRASVTGDAHRSRLRQMLVIAQVGVCFVLLAGAGLFVRTVRNLRAIDVGFRADGLTAVAFDLHAQGYSAAAGKTMLDGLAARLAARPDVHGTATAMSAPFMMGGLIFARLTPPGQTGAPPVTVTGNAVSQDYFRTIGLDFARGASFASGKPGANQIVVNEALAKKYFAGRDPVGQHVGMGGGEPSEIVGVVRNAKQYSVFEAEKPTYYMRLEPGFVDNVAFIVRSTADRADVVRAIREAVAELDPNLPVHDVRPIDSHVRESLAEQYASAWLVSLFGLLGVMLAVVGLYGVMAFNVTQRARELAIRVALGVRAERIGGGVVREGVLLAAAGVLLGLAGTYALARLVATRLYGVSPLDASTLLATSACVIGLAALASCIPARRATRADPMMALRGEG